jgi:predicted AAA+ superfamily ATPase
MATPNRGHLLENVVFLHLRRAGEAIHYIKTSSGKEVDFYIPRTGTLVQVTDSADNRAAMDREFTALAEAAAIYGAQRALIVYGQGHPAPGAGGPKVQLVPAAEFLCRSPESAWMPSGAGRAKTRD